MRKCQWIQFCSMKNPINQCSNKTNKNTRGMIGNNRNCSKEFTSLESMSNAYSFPTFKINTDASVYHLFGRTGFSFAFLQWLQLCISNIANMRIKSVRIEFHCASILNRNKIVWQITNCFFFVCKCFQKASMNEFNEKVDPKIVVHDEIRIVLKT